MVRVPPWVAVIALGLVFAVLPSQALAGAKGKPKTKASVITLNQDPVFSGQVATGKPCRSNRAVELIAASGTVVGTARTDSAGGFIAASSFRGRAYATVDKASRRNKGGKKVRCGAGRSGELVLGETTPSSADGGGPGRSADLRLGISGINAVAGMPHVLDYGLRVRNQGPGAAANVVVSAQTDSTGGPFVSSVPAICSGSGNATTCLLRTLRPGASAWITVRFGPCSVGPREFGFSAGVTTSTFDPDPLFNGDFEAVICPG